jgi:hypothetical protein
LGRAGSATLPSTPPSGTEATEPAGEEHLEGFGEARLAGAVASADDGETRSGGQLQGGGRADPPEARDAHRRQVRPRRSRVAGCGGLGGSGDGLADRPVESGGEGVVAVDGGEHVTLDVGRGVGRLEALEDGAEEVVIHDRGEYEVPGPRGGLLVYEYFLQVPVLRFPL